MPECRQAEHRLRHVRAGRLLRLPQDEGLRHEHAEARADPDEDRLEADAGLGEELDPQSARGQGNDVDAPLLVQLEQQLARGRRPQRGRDRRDHRVPVRQRGPARVRREEPAARRRQGRGDDRQGRSAASAAMSSARARAPRPGRAAPSASRSRTSATRPATSGSTTGSAIRSTTARPPTCRICGSPMRRWPTSRRICRTLKAPGGDAAKATAGSAGRRRGPARLSQGRDAVRGRQGDEWPRWNRSRSRWSWASAPSTGTAASAATTSRDSRRRRRSAPTCPKRAASSSRGSTSRSSARFRTPRSWRGSRPSCTIRASSTGAACCRRSTSCECRTSTSADEEVERLVTAIMSFQREIQPPAALPVRSARYDQLVAGRTLVNRRNCVGCHIIETDGRRLSEARGRFLARAAEADTGRRARAARLAVRVPARADHHPAVARRADADASGSNDAELNGVIRYFGSISNTIGPFQTHEIALDSGTIRRSARSCSICCKCQQCHVLGTIPKDQPTANLAPDLRMAPERLQPRLDRRLVEEPSRRSCPGTACRRTGRNFRSRHSRSSVATPRPRSARSATT